MTDAPDAVLLEQFARNGSEPAFAALVQRYIALVHSVALRHTANPQQAQDITQAVFIILARKAGALGTKTVLPGWLYHAARLTAANWQRAEARRVRREQEAFMQSKLEESATDAVWRELSPQLDKAMACLGTSERDALVLRYFQNKSMAKVGKFMGLEENTAQKRVSRALEKLRKFFTKRGVNSTTAIIAGAISANSVQVVPVALAKSVTAVALAKSVAAGGSTLTLVKGALKLMAWTKLKTAIVVGAGVLLATGTTTVTVKTIAAAKADDSWRVRNLDSRVLDRASPQVRILPAKYPQGGGYGSSGDSWMGLGTPAEVIVETAYHTGPARTIYATELPRSRYDFIAKLPRGAKPQETFAALQEEVKREFGLVGNLRMRDTDVLVLTVRRSNAPGLSPASARNRGSSWRTVPGEISQENGPLRNLASLLENRFRIPVIDRTGLNGNFDIRLKWNDGDRRPHNASVLKQALLDQLGLELVPSREPIEMLVVEKVK